MPLHHCTVWGFRVHGWPCSKGLTTECKKQTIHAVNYLILNMMKFHAGRLCPAWDVNQHCPAHSSSVSCLSDQTGNWGNAAPAFKLSSLYLTASPSHKNGDSANFIIVYCSNYLYAFTHKHTYTWREKKRYLHTNTHTYMKREEEIVTQRERYQREKERESCISCTLAGWQKNSLCSWRITLNFWFFCLQLLSAGVIGMCYLPNLCTIGDQTEGFMLTRQVLYKLSHITSPLHYCLLLLSIFYYTN